MGSAPHRSNVYRGDVKAGGHMACASTSVRFAAWAGTAQNLEDAIHALRKLVLSSGRPSVAIRTLRGGERQITFHELAAELPRKGPFQIVVEAEQSPDEDVVVVLGDALPPDAIHADDDYEEEEIPGNTITAVAATKAAALDLANRALDVLRPGIPRWAELTQRRQMSPLRLDNLAALVLVAVGLLAGLIAAWPVGIFFGIFIALVLLVVGLEIVGNLFPPFEVHDGRPRWRRRWWPAALLIGIPLALAVLIRIVLGPWGSP